MTNNTANMNCIFCQISNGTAPAHVLYQDSNVIAFMDKYPLAKGHVLIIPRTHAEKMHQVKDEELMHILPVAKKIAKAMGIENYNLLQNNGRIAHQAVFHVHFHIIPKRENEGLGLIWKVRNSISEQEIEEIASDIRSKIEK